MPAIRGGANSSAKSLQSQLFLVREKPLVGRLQSCRERNLRRPSEFGQASGVQQLAWGAVGFGSIEGQLAAKSNRFACHASQLGNTDVRPPTDVHRPFLAVVLHQKNAGICKIVDMQ